MASPLLIPLRSPWRLPSAVCSVQPAARATAAVTEIWRYLSGSHRSWLRQAEAVQDLDDRLRRDIGLPARATPRAGDWPGYGW